MSNQTYERRWTIDPYNYDCIELIYENGRSVLLQGDDAAQLDAETDIIAEIWTNDPDNSEGRPFSCYEEHTDVYLDAYLEVLE